MNQELTPFEKEVIEQQKHLNKLLEKHIHIAKEIEGHFSKIVKEMKDFKKVNDEFKKASQTLRSKLKNAPKES